jgi:hypothetical protein
MVAVLAASVSAQVPPTLQVFTDPSLNERFYRCGTPGTTDEVFVVLRDAPFVVSAVDFSIQYPASMIWLADLPPTNDYTSNEWVSIGNSPTGIAVAWANCCMVDGAQGPFVVMRALVYWFGNCDCAPIFVGGASPAKTHPTMVRNGDFREFDVVGMLTVYDPYLCDTPVEATTWGRVKALYRDSQH